MGKLVQLVLLGVIAWLVFRYLQRPGRLQGQGGQGADGHAGGAGPAAPAMRRCAHCSVHVPEGESTQSRGQFFCCEAHRDAYFRERSR